MREKLIFCLNAAWNCENSFHGDIESQKDYNAAAEKT